MEDDQPTAPQVPVHYEPGNEHSYRFLGNRKTHGWRFANVKGSGQDYTHSMLNGGVLKVPYSQMPLLRDSLAQDLDSDLNTRFYLTERATPVFPMYFDLDIKAATGQDGTPLFSYADLWATVRGVLQTDVLRQFFPRDTPPAVFDMVVCTTLAPKRCEGRFDYSGVHVYMPHLHVDATTARYLQYAVTAYLKHNCKSIPGAFGVPPWTDIVDSAVYTTGTLRMVGAKKLMDCHGAGCKKAQGKKAQGCPLLCDLRGRLCAGRQYGLLEVISDTREQLHNGAPCGQALGQQVRSWRGLLDATTLRLAPSAQVTPGFALPPGCDIPLFEKKLPRSAKARGMDCTPEQADTITYCVRSFNRNYSQLHVDKVVMNDKGTLMTVYVSGLNATYCTNKQAHHHSSRVYFCITPRGVCVKCLCQKDTDEGRQHGPCKKFKSPIKPNVLSPAAVELLFPHAKNVKRPAMPYLANALSAPPSGMTSPIGGLSATNTAPASPCTPRLRRSSGPATDRWMNFTEQERLQVMADIQCFQQQRRENERICRRRLL